jgi:hypothetical protein
MKACDSQNGNDGERNRPAQPEAFGVRFKRKAAGLSISILILRDSYVQGVHEIEGIKQGQL